MQVALPSALRTKPSSKTDARGCILTVKRLAGLVVWLNRNLRNRSQTVYQAYNGGTNGVNGGRPRPGIPNQWACWQNPISAVSKTKPVTTAKSMNRLFLVCFIFRLNELKIEYHMPGRSSVFEINCISKARSRCLRGNSTACSCTCYPPT